MYSFCKSISFSPYFEQRDVRYRLNFAISPWLVSLSATSGFHQCVIHKQGRLSHSISSSSPIRFIHLKLLGNAPKEMASTTVTDRAAVNCRWSVPNLQVLYLNRIQPHQFSNSEIPSILTFLQSADIDKLFFAALYNLTVIIKNRQIFVLFSLWRIVEVLQEKKTKLSSPTTTNNLSWFFRWFRFLCQLGCLQKPSKAPPHIHLYKWLLKRVASSNSKKAFFQARTNLLNSIVLFTSFHVFLLAVQWLSALAVPYITLSSLDICILVRPHQQCGPSISPIHFLLSWLSSMVVVHFAYDDDR